MEEEIEEISFFMVYKQWNLYLMYKHLRPVIMEHVNAKIKIFERSKLWDRPWWMNTSTGRFSVKSTREILRHKRRKDKLIVKI